MGEVRPATPDRFDEVLPLLEGFENRAMTPDDWRRMLFDLPWRVEEPHRGYILYEAGEAVGFLGTIFSARTREGVTRRFCNLSSWIVRPSHRASSLQLVMPVLALKSHTIVNLSASPTAHRVFTMLGFQTLETHQLLIPAVPSPLEWVRRPGRGVVAEPNAIMNALDGEPRAIASDVHHTLASQVLLTAAGRRCLVVATRSPWKTGRFLAHVQYASDWTMFWETPALAARAFRTILGTEGLRVDARWSRGRGPLLAKRRRLELPTLYRPASDEVTPIHVDGLYSEVFGQRWEGLRADPSGRST